MRKVFAVVVNLSVVAGSLAAASPARAAASVGASANCDVTGAHCVTGGGQSENAGTSTTGGWAAAVCYGASNGAFLLEVECMIGDQTSASSLPGPVGAAVVLAPTDTFWRYPVCWSVTGYFVDPLGGVDVLSTQGCSIVSV